MNFCICSNKSLHRSLNAEAEQLRFFLFDQFTHAKLKLCSLKTLKHMTNTIDTFDWHIRSASGWRSFSSAVRTQWQNKIAANNLNANLLYTHIKLVTKNWSERWTTSRYRYCPRYGFPLILHSHVRVRVALISEETKTTIKKIKWNHQQSIESSTESAIGILNLIGFDWILDWNVLVSCEHCLSSDLFRYLINPEPIRLPMMAPAVQLTWIN